MRDVTSLVNELKQTEARLKLYQAQLAFCEARIAELEHQLLTGKSSVDEETTFDSEWTVALR